MSVIDLSCPCMGCVVKAIDQALCWLHSLGTPDDSKKYDSFKIGQDQDPIGFPFVPSTHPYAFQEFRQRNHNYVHNNIMNNNCGVVQPSPHPPGADLTVPLLDELPRPAGARGAPRRKNSARMNRGSFSDTDPEDSSPSRLMKRGSCRFNGGASNTAAAAAATSPPQYQSHPHHHPLVQQGQGPVMRRNSADSTTSGEFSDNQQAAPVTTVGRSTSEGAVGEGSQQYHSPDATKLTHTAAHNGGGGGGIRGSTPIVRVNILRLLRNPGSIDDGLDTLDKRQEQQDQKQQHQQQQQQRTRFGSKDFSDPSVLSYNGFDTSIDSTATVDRQHRHGDRRNFYAEDNMNYNNSNNIGGGGGGTRNDPGSPEEINGVFLPSYSGIQHPRHQQQQQQQQHVRGGEGGYGGGGMTRGIDPSLPTIQFSELVLEKLIGGGAFGQVWKAEWRATPVAVKTFPNVCQVAGLPEQVVSSFEEEVTILAQMRHPNICLFMGVCITAPHRAIVTELLPRGSLWDALRSNNFGGGAGAGGAGGAAVAGGTAGSSQWPSWAIRKVLEGTCRGLAYLHSHTPQPLLHRDLKSANLLITDSFDIKICDFGLSKLRDFASVMTANVGTVQWMSPEMLLGLPYTESVDIYSIGVIMWELFTAECPYEGMSQIEVALAVTQEYSSNSQINAHRPSTSTTTTAAAAAADIPVSASHIMTAAALTPLVNSNSNSTAVVPINIMQSIIIPPPARPKAPPPSASCSPAQLHLMHACWATDPSHRPTAAQILHQLPLAYPQ